MQTAADVALENLRASLILDIMQESSGLDMEPCDAFFWYRDVMQYYSESESDDDMDFTPPPPEPERTDSPPPDSPRKESHVPNYEPESDVPKCKVVEPRDSAAFETVDPIVPLDVKFTVRGEEVESSRAAAQEAEAVSSAFAPKLLQAEANFDLSQGPLKHQGVSFNKTYQRWESKWWEGGRRMGKRFKVSEHGQEGAFRMAVELRLKYPFQVKNYGTVKGVRYERRRDSWRAEWSDDGRNRCKTFSVAQFGNAEAFRLAVAFRKEKESRKR